jgi:3-oxoadipate enol-lactonase
MPRIRIGEELKINYDEWGEGPPLVLIHANPFDNTLWMYQIAHFSTYCRVISLDIRGYGRSSKSDSAFGIPDLSDDVATVCRHLGVEKAIFGGISVGSAIIQQLAGVHPEMVQALILAGTGYSAPGTRRFAEERAKDYSAGISYRETHIRQLLSEEFQKTKLGAYLISMFVERNPTTSAETIVRLFEGYSGWDQQGAIDNLACPTIVVMGEKDRGLTRGIELHQRIPQSELAIIKSAGHACCLENPEDFDTAVLAFLRKHGLVKAPAT